jgi:hypothetical protein
MTFVRLPLLASLLFSSACGDDEPLTVRGDVAVDADGTPTGFEFVDTTRLVDLAPGESSDPAMAGSCILRVDDAVVVSLQAPGEPPEGVGLYRVDLTVWEERDPMVFAQLGAEQYGAEGGGGCESEILYRSDEDASAGVTVDCLLTTGPDGETAELSAELHFGGCSVRGFPSR